MEKLPSKLEPIKFGKYLLVDLIASGGMAQIYKALAKSPDGKLYPIAIKRILPQFAKDEEFISLLIDEAKVMVFMNHPNIVSIVEFGKVDESYYIAMEYVEGPTLQKLFRKVRAKKELFPIPIALYIAREIASGLAYSHRKTDQSGKAMHIVHRDISPANILMSYAGDIKITDFGISKAANQNHHTQVGIIRGKTGYMSPEQTRAGAEIDGRSDLFSLGIILYELLSGQRLFRADSVPKALKMVREGGIPPLSVARPGLPASLENLVYKALERNQSERFQSGEDFSDAINEFLTKYAASKNFSRITHMDLNRYIDRYFVHANEDTKSLRGGGAKTLGNVSEEVDPMDESASQIFAANPHFDIQDTSKPDIENAFRDEIVKRKRSLKNQATQSISSAPTGAFRRKKTVNSFMLLLFLAPFIGLLTWFGMKVYAEGPFWKNAKTTQVFLPIQSTPEGAQVYVDNVLWPEQTPTTLTLLDGVSVNIVFSKEGYKNVQRTIEPYADMTSLQLFLEPVDQVPSVTIVNVTSEPLGAEVKINGEPTGKLTPYRLEMKVGEEVNLGLSAQGYESKNVAIVANEAGRMNKAITLSKEAPKPRLKPTVRKRPTPRVKPLNKLGGNKAKNAIPSINLSVATAPWSEVYLDGKKVGVSPFVGLRVTPGRHTLRFVNEDLKLEEFETQVIFPKGKDVKCIYDLSKRSGSCE